MIRILSVIYLMIICQPVLGQMIADPYGKGNTESYGFILGLTEVEYEFNNHTNDVEVERTTLGFEYHFEGDDDGVQLFTQVAYTLDAEYRTLDGSGFSIGGGGHAFVAKIEEARLEGYIFANYIKEQYSGNSINTELDMLDIHLAPTIRFLANKTTQFYGALDMALYSDGSIETTVNGEKTEGDAERSNTASIKIGARFLMPQKKVFRAELSFFGDQNLNLALIF